MARRQQKPVTEGIKNLVNPTHLDATDMERIRVGVLRQAKTQAEREFLNEKLEQEFELLRSPQ